MQRFMIGRLLRAIFVLWGVSTVVFMVLRLSGDPVALMVAPDTPPAEIQRVRHELGLDRPLVVQYVVFLGDVLRGNFGRSLRFDEPAAGLVLERVRPTLELAMLSVLLTVVVGIPVGVLSALKRNSIYDAIAMSSALVGQSAPTFFVGIVLILIFSARLQVLPVGGRGEWYQLIMPVVTLGAFNVASIARLTRSAMLEVMGRDYIRTARAKGLGEGQVIMRHAARNFAIPIITVLGIEFGALLGGAVVVETVFAWPGMGRLVIQAINTRDYPVVQAAVFLLASGFVVTNTIVDILYGIVDPRIRYT
jgi:peptide/nickel transport system permease protein